MSSSVYINFTFRVPYFQVSEHSDRHRSQNTGPIGLGHNPSIFAINWQPTGIVLSSHLSQHLYLPPLLPIMYMKRMTYLHLGTRLSREVYLLILQTIIRGQSCKAIRGQWLNMTVEAINLNHLCNKLSEQRECSSFSSDLFLFAPLINNGWRRWGCLESIWRGPGLPGYIGSTCLKINN